MEKVIDCPVCYDTDNCFEDVQESFSSYLCFSCGFMSDSRYEIGSLKLIDNLKNSPKFVRESQFEDIHKNVSKLTQNQDSLIFFSKMALTIFFIFGLKLVLNKTFNLT